MKKIFTSILIVLCLICFSISSNAKELTETSIVETSIASEYGVDLHNISNNYENISETYLDNFAVHYFYNLNNNMAHNEIGTCSFVAASMLLSYYDSYWNDKIIDEKFESDKK